jgi:hypothetical protein
MRVLAKKQTRREFCARPVKPFGRGRSRQPGDACGHDSARRTGFALAAHFDVPLAPARYQLKIAAKNPVTGEAGVILANLDVPTFQSLGTKVKAASLVAIRSSIKLLCRDTNSYHDFGQLTFGL